MAKKAAIMIAAVLALYILLAYFSVSETQYRCEGAFSSEGADAPATVYIKIELYRRWVGIWSDSDGSLYLEIPNEWVHNYFHLAELGEQIQIYSDEGAELSGNFSTLSHTLALDTYRGFFDAQCERTE